MIKKAIPKWPKKAKPTKAVKKAKKEKPPPKPKAPTIGRIVFDSIVDTLEHNTLGGGEFDLPSVLTRTLDRSNPDYNLGLHRQYYIPIMSSSPYYVKGQKQLRDVLQNQATVILPALLEEGIVIKKVDMGYPLCRECE